MTAAIAADALRARLEKDGPAACARYSSSDYYPEHLSRRVANDVLTRFDGSLLNYMQEHCPPVLANLNEAARAVEAPVPTPLPTHTLSNLEILEKARQAGKDVTGGTADNAPAPTIAPTFDLDIQLQSLDFVWDDYSVERRATICLAFSANSDAAIEVLAAEAPSFDTSVLSTFLYSKC